jgi:hypothetical protein
MALTGAWGKTLGARAKCKYGRSWLLMLTCFLMGLLAPANCMAHQHGANTEEKHDATRTHSKQTPLFRKAALALKSGQYQTGTSPFHANRQTKSISNSPI